MDCFAVALGVCTCNRQSWKNILRMAFFFGLFQGVMPVIGWMAGVSMREIIASFDHWVAFIILALIGGKMIMQSFSLHNEERIHLLTFGTLISLSIATSIDALITGLSFGLINVNILKASIVIFMVTAMITVIGAKLGEKTRFIRARFAERMGGGILILIGIKVVLDHLGVW